MSSDSVNYSNVVLTCVPDFSPKMNWRRCPVRSTKRHLAARFAVREATMKALGVGLGAFDFHDVSVHKHPSGAPFLKVSGRAEELARTSGVGAWHVSITHTDTVAMAVVAAF